MRLRQIVLDTSVLVAGLRSSRGASHRLLQLIGKSRKFEINVSVPLVLKYEEVLKREARSLGMIHDDVNDLLDYLCKAGRKRNVFFLWRPFLSDPDDDLVLEVAVESSAEFIVTWNTRHFRGAEVFGIQAVTPGQLLESIGEAP
jgi:putative PIN family toxin of toxin-antitoxin system